jgi:hypothetical protein
LGVCRATALGRFSNLLPQSHFRFTCAAERLIAFKLPGEKREKRPRLKTYSQAIGDSETPLRWTKQQGNRGQTQNLFEDSRVSPHEHCQEVWCKERRTDGPLGDPAWTDRAVKANTLSVQPCKLYGGCFWVCEDHADKPWGGASEELTPATVAVPVCRVQPAIQATASTIPRCRKATWLS